MDLSDQVWPCLEKKHYDAAVFCAAATKLADCEEHPESSRKINVDTTISLAKLLELRNSYLLLLSTNQVFDGTKPYRKVSEPTCPINEYGRQKAEAERQILKLQCSAVLRLTKVVHSDLPLFRHWESCLLAGQPIAAFADMYLSPISIDDVVQRIDHLIRNRETGIFHLSGEQEVSYYYFAKTYFKYIAGSDTLIHKSSLNESSADRLI
jgi:dTDP-4-dehydrorhamnose reductase